MAMKEVLLFTLFMAVQQIMIFKIGIDMLQTTKTNRYINSKGGSPEEVNRGLHN